MQMAMNFQYHMIIILPSLYLCLICIYYTAMDYGPSIILEHRNYKSVVVVYQNETVYLHDIATTKKPIDLKLFKSALHCFAKNTVVFQDKNLIRSGMAFVR